ncbi:Thioredoxin family protein [Trichomonas vaginalis G3]|uniref:Thioredoxin family protein n=1 Tax=Trichomonas vaginalis (strain ATCC PRA-98 / G3) TaxID=412133 RepID=A2EZM0_TRIV3|nr:intramolecular oxidoreductase activity, transposing S-S bonds [Trichomonas vaginalis G3]EAY01928.1 Thioredoxin family protein [Trichomonas vaginalis G3]KAI5485298.1 intramolecular oxidoreductase activity, transposing S-S bonds [Trichomonas vaginalis G3]|eukprot:XP_001330446.1 Thioredoxin family protein [Trichomonas vaginalis G3]
MFSSFFLFLRVREPVGIEAILDRYTEENLTSFTEKNGINIMLFANDYDQVQFALNGVQKYKSVMNFGMAPQKLASSYKCKQFPCIVPFINGSLSLIDRPRAFSIPFTRWLSHLEEGLFQTIRNSEDLRLLLDSTKPLLFSIDSHEVPESLPENVPIYFANSSTFLEFNISITKGFYGYHPIYKTLEPISNFSELFNTSVVHPKGVRITERQFLAGYITNSMNKTDDEFFLENIRNLSNNPEFKDFFFTSLPNSNCRFIVEAGSFNKAAAPYFFVLNTSDLVGSNRRWIIIQKENLMNASYVEQFLTRIKNGQENYSLVSQPIPTEVDEYMKNVVRAVGLNVEEIIMQPKDVLIAVTATWCQHCHEFLPVLNQIADILKYKCVCAYIEADLNELPPIIDSHSGFPTLYFFGATDKVPVLFSGQRNLDRILEFLGNLCSPKFDPYDIEIPDATNSL